MKILSFACIILLLISCKKSTPEYTLEPGDQNQRLSADINLAGSNFHFAATGNYTLFNRSIYANSVTMINDTILKIQGGIGNRNLEINLFNVNTPGIYQFGQNTPRRSLQALYIPNSSVLGGGDYYFNKSGVLTGTINITVLTANHIEGNFSDSCWKGSTAASITNGSFSGNF